MWQHANLLLQMLLQANVYVTIIWAISYLLHLIIWSHMLWNYTGLAMLLAYVLAVGTEWMRLHASYSINLCTDATTMWLLLTLTPCVLLPALVYLRLAVVFASRWLAFLTNVQFVLMALEVLSALLHHVWRLASAKRESQNRPESRLGAY
ncbi:uncharacterized protein Dvir_GJ16965 [Drosophila virilis]|uniref:Transmembrane protein 17B n=2 Tax=Drosophila virilis TaxID=7244 RepID=B4M7B9_DROVI|nr:uncharacterized protein LOC6633848 [Drosophila virilis]EDW62686.2 uncharacterized protein Dvir_GJ16965 [Drosophila virilis]